MKLTSELNIAGLQSVIVCEDQQRQSHIAQDHPDHQRQIVSSRDSVFETKFTNEFDISRNAEIERPIEEIDETKGNRKQSTLFSVEMPSHDSFNAGESGRSDRICQQLIANPVQPGANRLNLESRRKNERPNTEV